MIKVTMIGAGSMVFSRNLTGDILSYPEFKNATICYMDIDSQRLAAAEAWGRRVAAGLNANPKFQATTNLAEALHGADAVIVMVQVGGFGSTLLDFEIPRKYGLEFTIADTTGPGGIFRALRTYGALTELCRSMQQHCPAALLLNYSNPMSMNMSVIADEGITQAVGLCHSVQATADRLTEYLGLNPGTLTFQCAGINHMAGFIRLEHRGQNLYPRLFQCAENSEIVRRDPVRFELFRRLGYFMTESSEHHAEYNPWFIPHGQERIRQFDIPIDEYLRRCDLSNDEFASLLRSAGDQSPVAHHKTTEYGSKVIHAFFCGGPEVVYGNMPNHGAISNLSPDAIVETPTLVDRGMLQLTCVGNLPLPLVAYVQPHICGHQLFMAAVKTGCREYVYQACLFDPLTAAVLTPDQIVDLCDELIAAHGPHIPPLKAGFPMRGTGRQMTPPSAADLLQARSHKMKK